MDSYRTYVEQSAAHVLANHEILLASPSASKLTSFYPTPSESQNTIAQAVCNSGQLTVQANSKNFNQSSDFLISTPNLMDTPHLRMKFDIPALTTDDAADNYAGSYHSGWGFDAIEQLEVTFANSNISNLQIKGHAMRDWSLLQCSNEKERQRMLNIAGRHKVKSRAKEFSMEAVVPLSFLFFRSAGGVKKGFPIDGRALNGPIIFRIRFAPLADFFGPHLSQDGIPSEHPTYPSTSITPQPFSGVTTGFPSSFSDLNMSFRTYQLMDGAFSVSKALEANPGYVYSLPSLWLNTYTQTTTISSKGYGSINLNSAPAGMIQAMILRIRPVNDINEPNSPLTNYNSGSYTTDDQILRRAYRPWSLPLKNLKLSYSGQAIFWAQSAEELSQFYSSTFQDDLKTDICGTASHLSVRSNNFPNPTSFVNEEPSAPCFHETQILVIPLMHDGNAVFRHRDFENLPHYSGSTLQLEFTCDETNYYNSDGYDRILCNKNTGLYPPLTLQESATKCYSFPSIRTQGEDPTSTNVGTYETNFTAAGARAYVPEGEVGATGGKVQVDITYVVPALFQVTNGVAELQL